MHGGFMRWIEQPLSGHSFPTQELRVVTGYLLATHAGYFSIHAAEVSNAAGRPPVVIERKDKCEGFVRLRRNEFNAPSFKKRSVDHAGGGIGNASAYRVPRIYRTSEATGRNGWKKSEGPAIEER
jgi:hypothetical protein